MRSSKLPGKTANRFAALDEPDIHSTFITHSVNSTDPMYNDNDVIMNNACYNKEADRSLSPSPSYSGMSGASGGEDYGAPSPSPSLRSYKCNSLFVSIRDDDRSSVTIRY